LSIHSYPPLEVVPDYDGTKEVGIPVFAEILFTSIINSLWDFQLDSLIV
jgi:hypothetical protein